MPTPKTRVRVRLEELLADGDWHDREPVIAELMPLVEPGKASRVALQLRAHNRRQRVAAGRTGPHNGGGVTPSDRAGARYIARRTIGSAAKRGTVETRTVDGTVQIRLATGAGTP
jgi:hypothetical protein